MNSYISLSIKKETARNFKEFAKTQECSYSELLDHMIEFFIGHQLSPLADFDEALSAREEKLLKRINNVISIVRNIEKTQTQPTLAILETLMVSDQSKNTVSPSNNTYMIPEQNKSSEVMNSNSEKNTFPASNINKVKPGKDNSVGHPRPQNLTHVSENNNLIQREKLSDLLHYLISRVKIKKQLFGEPDLILDITREEFRRIEIKIKSKPDVH